MCSASSGSICPASPPTRPKSSTTSAEPFATFPFFRYNRRRRPTGTHRKKEDLPMKKLGFGCMRLPLTDPSDVTSIDMPQFEAMVDRFLEQGFTYFDTAYVYHSRTSEKAVGQALVARHPRDSFTLATSCRLPPSRPLRTGTASSRSSWKTAGWTTSTTTCCTTSTPAPGPPSEARLLYLAAPEKGRGRHQADGLLLP